MLKWSSFLFAVTVVFSIPAWGGESASDSIFRASMYNAAQKAPSDTLKPAFTTSDPDRMSVFGRFPLGFDLHHPKVSLGDKWSVGWTNDQYGKSLGFSHPLPLGKDGTVRFGLIRENLANVPTRTAAGVSISFSW